MPPSLCQPLFAARYAVAALYYAYAITLVYASVWIRRRAFRRYASAALMLRRYAAPSLAYALRVTRRCRRHILLLYCRYCYAAFAMLFHYAFAVLPPASALS